MRFTYRSRSYGHTSKIALLRLINDFAPKLIPRHIVVGGTTSPVFQCRVSGSRIQDEVTFNGQRPNTAMHLRTGYKKQHLTTTFLLQVAYLNNIIENTEHIPSQKNTSTSG
jgi:hypothetical protein